MASFKQKQVGKGRERVKIEILVPSISYQIRNRELKKIAKKFKKIRKHQYGFFSGQNNLEMLRKSDNKNYRSNHFLPDPL